MRTIPSILPLLMLSFSLPAQTYTLTVSNGVNVTGYSGYTAGQTAYVCPAYQTNSVFAYWQDPDKHLDNTNAFSTFITMPASNYTVTATYTFSAETNWVTPQGWLTMQPQPVAKAGTSLPRNSTYFQPFQWQLALAIANWGYYVPFGDIYKSTAWSISNVLAGATNSDGWQEAHASALNPSLYPLQVERDKFWPYAPYGSHMPDTNAFNPPKDFWVTNSLGQYVDVNTNMWDSLTNTTLVPDYSPNVSDASLALLTTYLTTNFAGLEPFGARIGMITDAGEWLLPGPLSGHKNYRYDPRWWVETNGYSETEFVSHAMGRWLSAGYNAAKAAEPAAVYSYYTSFNGAQKKYIFAGSYANDADFFNNYSYNFDPIYGNTNQTYAAGQYYYQGEPYLTNNYGDAKYNSGDALIQMMNMVGYCASNGTSMYHYDWLSGGYDESHSAKTNLLIDVDSYSTGRLPRFLGQLKMFYLAGMVGANVGWYNSMLVTKSPSIWGEYNHLPADGAGYNPYAGSFPTNLAPHWLMQVREAGEARAFATRFDDLLLHSTLLVGNGTNWMSNNHPSYEFTNSLGDSTIRIIARQANTGDTNRWLLGSWAPFTNTTVSTYVPTLGNVTLLARPEAAWYYGTPGAITLQDANGMLPTETATNAVNSQFPAVATDRFILLIHP
ncbi:MAG: hypothetical protein KGL39_22895 [Patescibacteria group bacterium]|nr:hypothetical protein [Patescibacteria group bacterium]